MEQTQPVTDADVLAKSLGELPQAVARPVLVVVSGLPGIGKSYFCRRLSDSLAAAVLESDALRRMLFPQPSHSQQESARLFKAIHRLAERLLRQGRCIILDATNLSERYREYLYSIAGRLEVKLVLVSVRAPLPLVKERLAQRASSGEGNSDAGWEVYRKMKSSVEKIRRKHYVADTSQDITPVIDRIMKEIRRG